jgi:hypothetical protein
MRNPQLRRAFLNIRRPSRDHRTAQSEGPDDERSTWAAVDLGRVHHRRWTENLEVGMLETLKLV